MSGRALLRRLYDAALEGADPEAAVRRALERPDVARALAGARTVGLFAVGKAAARMAAKMPRPPTARLSPMSLALRSKTCATSHRSTPDSIP